MFAMALTTVLVLQCVKNDTGAKIWLPFITGFLCFASVITFLFFLPATSASSRGEWASTWT